MDFELIPVSFPIRTTKVYNCSRNNLRNGLLSVPIVEVTMSCSSAGFGVNYWSILNTNNSFNYLKIGLGIQILYIYIYILLYSQRRKQFYNFVQQTISRLELTLHIVLFSTQATVSTISKIDLDYRQYKLFHSQHK